MRPFWNLNYAVVTGLLLLFILPQIGCPDGGANENEHTVGDENGGVKVGFGDVAVAPTGDFVLFWARDRLMVGEPHSGESHALPVQSPTRLAFANDKDVVYVGVRHDHQPDEIVAVDVAAASVLWTVEVPDASTEALRIASSTSDQRVVVAAQTEIKIIDALSGRIIRSHTLAREAIDLKILDDDRRALVVQAHEFVDTFPQTEISVIELKTGEERTISVPNCADTIAIDAANNRALMAPTTCQRDPVSIISLDRGEERFVRNLPGFGPVAIASDGARAVAFVDAQNIDEALFDDPDQIPNPRGVRFHLMVIDTATLSYTLHPVGEELPRYRVTNDGQVVLVDFEGDRERGTRLFDLETGTMRDIAGPAVTLDNFTMTSDSTHAYGIGPRSANDGDLSKALFHIDVARERSDWMGLEFMPININISADDSKLFLRKDYATVCVYSLAEGECVRELGARGSVARGGSPTR
jgi:hypothetical protein